MVHSRAEFWQADNVKGTSVSIEHEDSRGTNIKEFLEGLLVWKWSEIVRHDGEKQPTSDVAYSAMITPYHVNIDHLRLA